MDGKVAALRWRIYAVRDDLSIRVLVDWIKRVDEEDLSDGFSSQPRSSKLAVVR